MVQLVQLYQFQSILLGIKEKQHSILMCGTEWIVVASPHSCFANGQSNQFTNIDFRRKNITQSLHEEYTFVN